MARLRTSLLCGVMAATAVFMAGLVWFSASISQFAPVAVRLTSPQTTDAIVVLTGGERRIGEAMRLFEAGVAQRLLISGVHSRTPRSDVRRRAGLAPVLFDCCIDVGYTARNTMGNAAEAHEWIRTWGFKRLIVVTSHYHMPRALFEFARLMPDVELVPHAVQQVSGVWWSEPARARLVVSEYLKTIVAAGRWALARGA